MYIFIKYEDPDDGKVYQILPNEFRNIEEYEILDEKVDHLAGVMESTGEIVTINFNGRDWLRDTGFWDNTNAYVPTPELGKKVAALELASMEEQLLFSIELLKSESLRKLYGHHRLMALLKRGINIVNIPVKYVDRATRLKIMAEENFESFGGNSATTLESITTAVDFIMSEVAQHDTFAAYAKAKGAKTAAQKKALLISSSQAWSKCKKDGIPGITVVNKFLEKWPEATVRAGLSAYSQLKEGYYRLPLAKSMTSVDQLRAFCALVDAISDNSAYWRGLMPYIIERCGKLIVQKGISSVYIRTVIDHVKNSKDPIEFLKSEQPVAYDFGTFIYQLVKDNNGEGDFLRNNPLLQHDTVMGKIEEAEKKYKTGKDRQLRQSIEDEGKKEGWTPEQIAEKQKEAGVYVEPRKAKEGEAPIGADGEEAEPGADAGGVGDGGGEETPSGDGGEGGEVVDLTSAEHRYSTTNIKSYCDITIATALTQLPDLIGKMKEIADTAAEDDKFIAQMEDLFKVTSYLLFEVEGGKALRQRLNKIIATPVEEANLPVSAAELDTESVG